MKILSFQSATRLRICGVVPIMTLEGDIVDAAKTSRTIWPLRGEVRSLAGRWERGLGLSSSREHVDRGSTAEDAEKTGDYLNRSSLGSSLACGIMIPPACSNWIKVALLSNRFLNHRCPLSPSTARILGARRPSDLTPLPSSRSKAT